MKIGILGGSFDPIHKGHLTLARESQRQFGLGKVLFVPALLPPHKKGDSPAASAPVRTRMVEFAILGEPNWELCDLELRRSGVSYTVDTLRELRTIYPSPHQLFFIAGADSFRDLKTWREPEEILRLCEWIVAPRPGVQLPQRLPVGFHLLQMALVEISATELRKKIEQDEDISEWIPKKVISYMRQMKVYKERTK